MAGQTVTDEELVDRVMAASRRGESPFGLYVFPASDPAAQLARRVERDVFSEYFGNTTDVLEAEYGPYEEASLFFCVLDHRRRIPVGVMRVILPSPRGFKTLHDIERIWGQPLHRILDEGRVPLDTARLWDVATIAVAADYRRAATHGLISLALYQALCTLVTKHEIGWIVAVFDLIALDLCQGQLGRPLAGFPGLEPRGYLDSPASVPVYGDVADYKVRLAFADPALYELLMTGHGLEAAVSRPNWERDLGRHDGIASTG